MRPTELLPLGAIPGWCVSHGCLSRVSASVHAGSMLLYLRVGSDGQGW